MLFARAQAVEFWTGQAKPAGVPCMKEAEYTARYFGSSSEGPVMAVPSLCVCLMCDLLSSSYYDCVHLACGKWFRQG